MNYQCQLIEWYVCLIFGVFNVHSLCFLCWISCWMVWQFLVKWCGDIYIFHAWNSCSTIDSFCILIGCCSAAGILEYYCFSCEYPVMDPSSLQEYSTKAWFITGCWEWNWHISASCTFYRLLGQYLFPLELSVFCHLKLALVQEVMGTISVAEHSFHTSV